MSRSQRRTLELLLTLAAPLLILAIWELLSKTERINPIFWPAPTDLWPTFVKLLESGDLTEAIALTTTRIIGGFLLGAIPGILLGLAMGLSWPLRVFMMPIASAIYAIPKIAILPLVIIAFGTGEESKLAIIALSIFFLVVLNTMSGVLGIDPIYHDVAENFGAGRWQRFISVAFPGALPSIFTGLRLAMGFSLIVIVGTEFVANAPGVGRLIWESWQTLAIKKMYVGLVIVALMGWLLNLLIDLVERKALPWRQQR